MAKPCAYCGEEKRLTEEHVWPSAFLDRIGRGGAHYSIQSDAVHGADYVVKDVCAECNNVRLDPLDRYFCQFYDEFLSTDLDPDEGATLRYDYDLLCRALLKIAFNTARSAGSEIAPFLRLRRYILQGGNSPPGLALIAELVSPSLGLSHTHEGPGISEIPSPSYRSIRGQLGSAHGSAVLVRILTVHDFFFHLLLAKQTNDFRAFQAAKADYLRREAPGSNLIAANSAIATLNRSPQTGATSLLPQAIPRIEKYREYFKRKRKSR